MSRLVGFCLLFALCSLTAFVGVGLVFGAELPPGWTATPPVTVSVPASAYTPPAASPDVAAAAAATAADKPAAATRSFKRTLGDAATAAFREGQITRWQLARIRLAILVRPEAMAEIQASVIDQAVQDGVLRDGAPAALDGFDWSGLLAFIQQLLPLIMQIIAMF